MKPTTPEELAAELIGILKTLVERPFRHAEIIDPDKIDGPINAFFTGRVRDCLWNDAE